MPTSYRSFQRFDNSRRVFRGHPSVSWSAKRDATLGRFEKRAFSWDSTDSLKPPKQSQKRRLVGFSGSVRRRTLPNEPAIGHSKLNTNRDPGPSGNRTARQEAGSQVMQLPSRAVVFWA